VFDGVQVSAHGALQGLKDTRVPMGIALVTYWGVGLTTGYYWGVREGSPEGLWWGLVVGLATAAVLLVGRFHRQVGPAVRASTTGPGVSSVQVPADGTGAASFPGPTDGPSYAADHPKR
jgi:MATE family multidrug resistance protein